MSGKTVVLTGATQGIGKATALALGARGADLVLVNRNAEKSAAVADEVRKTGANVDTVLADLSSLAEVRRAAGEIRARHPKIHVLLNNAGVIVPSRRLTVDGLETTFATNHLAYFLLTNELLDVLKATGTPDAKARIVNVSSHAHRSAREGLDFDDLQAAKRYQPFKVYSRSKLANLLFTYELARRLEGTNVTVNALHPGVIASGFGRTYGGFISFLVKLGAPFMITPEEGARTSVHLASSPEVEGVSGQYFSRSKPDRSTRASHDEAAQKRLWELSEALTGVRATTAAA